MRNAELRQALIKLLVGFLKAVAILLAAIEIDLQAGLLDRRSVDFGQIHRVDRTEELFVGRGAEDIADDLQHELRTAIIAGRVRQFRKQRGAMCRHR